MNLLDDSLSADLAREGGLSDAMTERFLALGRYAASTGSDAILFTCSAFGPCIEAVARAHAPMPVLKPNEAMIELAVARGQRIGLLSTFPPTLVSMPPEFPSSVEIVPKLAEGALAALDRGDRAMHDRLVVEASKDLTRLRPDRARAIQHGACSGTGRGSDRAAGAHHARQRGRETEGNAVRSSRLGFARPPEKRDDDAVQSARCIVENGSRRSRRPDPGRAEPCRAAPPAVPQRPDGSLLAGARSMRPMCRVSSPWPRPSNPSSTRAHSAYEASVRAQRCRRIRSSVSHR